MLRKYFRKYGIPYVMCHLYIEREREWRRERERERGRGRGEGGREGETDRKTKQDRNRGKYSFFLYYCVFLSLPLDWASYKQGSMCL